VEAIQRAVVVLLGELGHPAETRVRSLITSAYESIGKPFPDYLCQTAAVTTEDFKEPNGSDSLLTLLRSLVARANPGPAARTPSNSEPNIEKETTVYLVFQSWEAGITPLADTAIRTAHSACQERSIDGKLHVVVALPGVCGLDRPVNADVHACELLKSLELVFAERGRAFPWGDNAPFESVWLLDGVNSQGQDVVSEGDTSVLVVDAVATLVLYGSNFSPIASSVLTDVSDGRVQCFRSLGLIRACIPKERVLSGICDRFSAHVVHDRIISGRRVFLEELALAGLDLEKDILDLRKLVGAISLDEEGECLCPSFLPKLDETLSNEAYLAALKRLAESHRSDQFRSACRLLFPISQEVTASTIQELGVSIAGDIEAHDRGIKYAIGLLDTLLDLGTESTFIDDKRRQTSPYSFDAARKDLRAETESLLGMQQVRDRLAEIPIIIDSLQARLSELEAVLSEEESSFATQTRTEREVEQQKLQVKTEMAQVPAKVAQLEEEQRELENRLAFVNSLWSETTDTGFLHELLEAALERRFGEIEDALSELEGSREQAIAKRDQILEKRSRVAWWSFLLLPVAVLFLTLLLGLGMGLAQVWPFRELFSLLTGKLVGVGLIGYYVIAGFHYVWKVGWRVTELSRRIRTCAQQRTAKRLEAVDTLREHFERIFKIRVLERVADIIDAAEERVQELRTLLQEFYEGCLEALPKEEANGCESCASPMYVEMLPDNADSFLFGRISTFELEALTNKFFQGMDPCLSHRAMSGREGIEGLLDELKAFGERAFLPIVNSLKVEDLLYLDEYRQLRSSFGLSWHSFSRALEQVAPFVRLRDLPGGKGVAVSKLVGVENIINSNLRKELQDWELPVRFFSTFDEFSVIAFAVTSPFGFDYLHSPSCGEILNQEAAE